VEKGLAST